MTGDSRKGASYESFFGFREKPFSLKPDPRFFYFSKKHREALAQLIYGVKERKGFIVLSGEKGTGKTTTVKALLERLDENCKFSYLVNPKLPITGFLRHVCRDFGLKVDSRSKIDCLTKLHDFLLDSHEKDKTTILIIDEAQNLDAAMFEEVRMLTNLETSSQKLLQIFLVGESSLDDLLDRGELWQLKQRISIRYYLPPLDCQETKEYIRTRMSIAGAKNLNCFMEGAIQGIYRYSQGVPRLINTIGDKCLVLGHAKKTRFIDERIVQESVDDLKLDWIPKDYKRRMQPREIHYGGRTFTYSPMILMVLLLAFVISGMGYFFGGRLPWNKNETVSSVGSQAQRPEMIDLPAYQTRKAVDESEPDDPSTQSRSGPVTESLVSEAVPMRDSDAGEPGRIEASPSKALRGLKPEPETEDLSQMDTDQVAQLSQIQREIDSVLAQKEPGNLEKKEEILTTRDESLRSEEEFLRELGEIEGPVKASEEARLPEESSVDRLKTREQPPTPRGDSFRSEEEFLRELGEIEGPVRAAEEVRPPEESSVGALEKSKEKKGAVPPLVGASARTSEEVKEPSRKPLVAIADEVEESSRGRSVGQRGTGKAPSVRARSETTPKKKVARVGPESTTESLDPETVKKRKDLSPELEVGALEKGRQEGETPVAIEEEEVKRFFARYVESYNRKDIESFLSLFSPKAMQNGKDGIQNIRKIYSEFFDQSYKLRYRLEDTRIEVYQNAVQARARYKVDQILKRGGDRRAWRGDLRLVLVKENGSLKVVSLDYRHQKSR